MKGKILIILLAIMALCMYFFWVYLPVHKSYGDFVAYVAGIIHKKQRADAIAQSVTPHLHGIFKTLTLVVGILLLVLVAVAIRYAEKLTALLKRFLHFLLYPFQSFYATWKQMENLSKVVLFAALTILIAQGLWYIMHYAVTHDEAYSMNNFMMNGPVVAATFYPYPNNHILYSMVSYFFGFLPVPYAVAYRLPSLMAMFIGSIALFKLVRHFAKDVIAALAVTIFVTALPVVVYSFLARGYSFLFMFCNASLLALVNIETGNRKKYWIYFTAFSIAGLYTIPSYIYVYTIMMVSCFLYWLMNKKHAQLKSLCISGMVCAIITLLLYLPVIVSSGGWSNFHKILYVGYDKLPTITGADIANFASIIYDYSYNEKPMAAWALIIVVTIAAIALWIKTGSTSATNNKLRLVLHIAIVGFYFPIFCFMIQRTYFAHRIFFHLVAYSLLFLVMSINVCIPAKRQFAIMVLCSAFFVSCYGLFGRKSIMEHSHSDEDRSAWLISKTMLQQSNTAIDTCYTFSAFFLPALQLDYRVKGKELYVYQQYQGSPSTKAFSFNDNYPWVIVDTASHIPELATIDKYYNAVIVRNNVVLWKRK